MSRRASVPSRTGPGGKRVVTRKAGGKDDERRGTKRKRPEEEEDADEREEKRARLCVEEALTECAKRDCPWCGRAIIKGFGCNHISCVCGRGFCYNCGNAYCIGRCASKQPLSLAEAARTACRKLKKQNPSLTFRQCRAIIGKNWLKKEVRPDDEYDDDDVVQSSDDDVGDENESADVAVGGENSTAVSSDDEMGNENAAADEGVGDENSSSEDSVGDDDCDSASDSGDSGYASE